MWDLQSCRDALSSARTQSQIWGALDHVQSTLRADAFAASRLHDDRPSRESDHIAHIPAPALDEWWDVEACQIDPVMQRLKTSSEPIYWDRETYAAAGKAPMWEALSKGGLSQGVGAVIHMKGGQHFLLGFDWSDKAARDSRFKFEAMAATQFLIPFVESCSRRVLAEEAGDRPIEALSARELQCLKLVAGGKTAWEIAKILGISPHTANKHIDNCVRKLDVANRTHAATTALRQGLI